MPANYSASICLSFLFFFTWVSFSFIFHEQSFLDPRWFYEFEFKMLILASIRFFVLTESQTVCNQSMIFYLDSEELSLSFWGWVWKASGSCVTQTTFWLLKFRRIVWWCIVIVLARGPILCVVTFWSSWCLNGILWIWCLYFCFECRSSYNF